MILADTSIWIDHFRSGDPVLRKLLGRNLVAIHPFIVGELACGQLAQRSHILGLLQQLPSVTEAGHDEVLFFIERNDLMGRGIGWIDAHLLASTRLGSPVRLWSRDKRLAEIAGGLGLVWNPTRE